MRTAEDKFGIDLDNYEYDELRDKNKETAIKISSALAGSKLYSMGSLLSGKPEQTFMIELNRAQVEQNFILIRQNEEIIRWLKALYGQNMNR